MSWKKGDEPIDFENNIKLWRKVLMTAIQKRRGQLSCEKCGAVKRSANGFISHMQFCGKSEEERQALMASCSICGAVMMPSSMEMHERAHRQTERSKINELQLYSAINERTKRKAAEKAISKISEFTELVKDSNLPPEKKMKPDSSLLKSLIKMPEYKRPIPSVWKGIWKKILSSGGTINCRQVGCTYTCSSLEDMCEHVSKCNFTPEESYICKKCKFSTTSDEDIKKHVLEKHAITDEVDKYSDFEEEDCSSDEKTSSTMKFLYKEKFRKIKWKEPYMLGVQWSMEFEQTNYELCLFNDYFPNQFTLLNNSDILKYLPELEISMRTKKESVSKTLCNTEDTWKQWKRFEGGLDEGTPIFFTGGPVWSLAWLPIPSPMYSKEPCQYIAISTHPKMTSEYTVGKSHSEPNMIQIWNVGSLNHEIDSKIESPTLSYAIVHNSGTIWCLEWCPSGCYQDESLNNYKNENKIPSNLKRMGMLAAACSNGNVNVYSLPFPEELKFKKTTDNGWPIYSTDPVITLVVNISMYDNNDQNWQCTKLSWTKEHGHNTIAAGFSNGYIALWDLTYKSPLSIQKRKNTYFINAFQHFYAHGNAVSMLELIPYNKGRFLASGSLDRSYKFWNLEDINSPQISMQKSIIVNGAWMTHWPCAVITFDDALGYNHTYTYLISLREHEYKYYPILQTNSTTYAVATSDYANSIAHGTLAGEIQTIFAHGLIYNRDIEKALAKKKMVSSFVKIVDFSEKEDSKDDKKHKKNLKDYCYMPGTYDQCRDRFGIVFCDKLKSVEHHEQKQPNEEELPEVPLEEYPFMSVNRMSWNPNAWSYLWMVVGYQNGLVRLLNFRYMSVSRELKMLLPQYVKSMLHKAKITTEERC